MRLTATTIAAQTCEAKSISVSLSSVEQHCSIGRPNCSTCRCESSTKCSHHFFSTLFSLLLTSGEAFEFLFLFSSLFFDKLELIYFRIFGMSISLLFILLYHTFNECLYQIRLYCTCYCRLVF